MFQEGLGTLKGFKAIIYVDHDAPPRFHPACSVPFALRDNVNEELQRLQTESTIEPVELAELAAPTVAVLKKDKNTVCICSDFIVTVNPVSKLDRYPIAYGANYRTIPIIGTECTNYRLPKIPTKYGSFTVHRLRGSFDSF